MCKYQVMSNQKTTWTRSKEFNQNELVSTQVHYINMFACDLDCLCRSQHTHPHHPVKDWIMVVKSQRMEKAGHRRLKSILCARVCPTIEILREDDKCWKIWNLEGHENQKEQVVDAGFVLTGKESTCTGTMQLNLLFFFTNVGFNILGTGAKPLIFPNLNVQFATCCSQFNFNQTEYNQFRFCLFWTYSRKRHALQFFLRNALVLLAMSHKETIWSKRCRFSATSKWHCSSTQLPLTYHAYEPQATFAILHFSPNPAVFKVLKVGQTGIAFVKTTLKDRITPHVSFYQQTTKERWSRRKG